MIARGQNTPSLIRNPDKMTSNGSTSVYSEDELRKLMHFIKQIKVMGRKDGYSACMVGEYRVPRHRNCAKISLGRLMMFFSENPGHLFALPSPLIVIHSSMKVFQLFRSTRGSSQCQSIHPWKQERAYVADQNNVLLAIICARGTSQR